MLDQSITKKSVKVLGVNAWKKFDSGVDYNVFVDDVFNKIQEGISDEGYSFQPFIKKQYKGKVGYQPFSPEDELVIKKLNDSVRRLFKVHSSDRHAIIRQTIALAEDSQPMTVARLDIKDFYESIDRSEIIKYVTEEWLLSHFNRMVLKNWDEQLVKQGVFGLPRGMSLSATLSEIKIRLFDREVRKNSNVYYYARYVDDIVVFYTGDKAELEDFLKGALHKTANELSFNTTKNNSFSLGEGEADRSALIDYLGYKIVIEPLNGSSLIKRKVRVLISDKKIKKIKSRVRKSFSAYNRDRRFVLLVARLRFLSGNQFIIGDIERTKLKSGIYYNYPLINDFSQLQELDGFYKKMISSKKGPAAEALKHIRKYHGNPYNSRVKSVESISFSFGFHNRIMNNFSSDVSKKIRRCW